jgi:hypothetical protein
VTLLLRRWTFSCNWRSTSFLLYCIVLYCIVDTIFDPTQVNCATGCLLIAVCILQNRAFQSFQDFSIKVIEYRVIDDYQNSQCRRYCDILASRQLSMLQNIPVTRTTTANPVRVILKKLSYILGCSSCFDAHSSPVTYLVHFARMHDWRWRCLFPVS